MSRARTSPPAASLVEPRGSHRARPMRPAAAASACARAGTTRGRSTRGTWQIVVTEIPYQVQKGKLIEQIAAAARRQEAAAAGRRARRERRRRSASCWSPRARTVDPDVLMESLFRLTELETRFPLNMNVLDAAARAARDGPAARCCGPGSTIATTCWCAAPASPGGKIARAAGNPRRLPDRLPQPRRGDPHHPRARTSPSPC